MKLCEFSLNQKWTLLYRGSEDGFGSFDFHSECDGQSKTLKIIRAEGTSYNFGGFTNAAWDSSGQWRQDANAFIFSLVNQESKPIKMKTIRPQYAIACVQSDGPRFGGGIDLYIANNANSNTSSYVDLGHSYIHPLYAYGTAQAKNFMESSFNFKVDEIEVYAKN